MTESLPEREPSLIQQRMTLERARNYSIVMTVVFGANAAWWLARGLFDGGDVIFWVLAGLFAIVVVMGAFSLVSARRKLRAFEAEHGPDAGKRS
ncbi:hypothetical protein [Microbacterium sp. NPDC089696]|uniref:hypothetical protein n=1 Tax=Microbacterium sp. NPDC089696 TaxID=3364199 RepID=UPI00381FCE50